MLLPSPGLLFKVGGQLSGNRRVRSAQHGVLTQSDLAAYAAKHPTIKFIVMAAFAFVNGWVDSISLNRYKAFATMMVGNILQLGRAVVSWAVEGKGGDDGVPDPVFYLLLVLTFTVSTAGFRVLSKRGWSTKTFALIALVWIPLHDVWEAVTMVRSEQRIINRWNVLRLAPIFAVIDSMAVQNGMGALPWCTTGQVVTVGYTLPDVLAGQASDKEIEKLVVALLMMASTIAGSVAGAAFDIINETANLEYTVVAPLIFVLMWLYDPVFRTSSSPKKTSPIGGLSGSSAGLNGSSAPLLAT